MKYLEKRDELIAMCHTLVNKGYVVGTAGNVSVRIPGESLALITPSGRDYLLLEAEDLILVDLDANKVDGIHTPSIETGLHMKLMKERPDIGAVVHTHSTFALAQAVSRQTIGAIVDEMLPYIGGSLVTADYGAPGSDELAENVLKTIGDKNACLVANHGAVGVGKDLNHAFLMCELAEKICQINIYSKMLGNQTTIPQEVIDGGREYFLSKK